MQGAICVTIIICGISVVAMLNHLEIVDDFFGLKFDKSLFDCIDHSMFSIILSAALILWIYQSDSWCIVYENSICTKIACGEFWWYVCDCCCRGHGDYDDGITDNPDTNQLNDFMAPILMEDSTNTARTGTPKGIPHMRGPPGFANNNTPTISHFSYYNAENMTLQDSVDGGGAINDGNGIIKIRKVSAAASVDVLS